jgi:hypothetical protein
VHRIEQVTATALQAAAPDPVGNGRLLGLEQLVEVRTDM